MVLVDRFYQGYIVSVFLTSSLRVSHFVLYLVKEVCPKEMGG